MPDEPIRDTVYFYKFNNYYNRIIKKYDTIEDYGTPMLTQTNCNFVHGDGVNSSFTINKGLAILDTPDYCVVEDYNGNISRWFVTNSFKTRSGQDSLTLRRDLIADFYSDIINFSPCLIRKGYVDKTNPLIFQDEGVQYNKIKQNEILIKDESNCSYIVGFIGNNAFESNTTVNGTIKADNYDYVYSTLADFPLKNYVEGAGNTHSQTARIAKNNNFNGRVHYGLKISARRSDATSIQRNYEFFVNAYGLNKPVGVSSVYSNQYSSDIYYSSGNMANSVRLEADANVGTQGATEAAFGLVANRYIPLFVSRLNLQNSDIVQSSKTVLQLNEDKFAEISQYVGKRIKIGNVIYDCSLAKNNETLRDIKYSDFISSTWTVMSNGFNNYQPSNNDLANQVTSRQTLRYISNDYNRYTGINNEIRVICLTEDTYLLFTEAQVSISTEVQSSTNRTHLTTQPYDMFMLINESNIPYKVGVTNYVSNHEVNMNIAQAICQASGTGAYDIQIVPFNPMRGTILADGTLNFFNYDVHEIKNSDNEIIGHYVMCNSSDLRFTLEKDELKFNPEDYKKDYNLKQYRLCSPNQETAFDFSPAMNGGINTWEISCNYRPYASYIKVQPTWNWLYGQADYNALTDFRGLVYNSSLCITQLNDAWSNYVSNNKNYQQLFDNQINTLTKTQNIQLNAMEETLGWRSYTGMPISSIARVIGGSKDIEMQRELNNVALGKMQTDFNYQMDNIKSMPHTIKKLTSINEDTRIFPYIEVYSCSATEEQSFDYKIQYTGMTIMTTGKITDYIQEGVETFVQADLIRLDLSRSEETADNHIAIEIASELEKGIYLTKESE